MKLWLKTETKNRSRRDRVNHASTINEDLDHVGTDLREGREYRGADGIFRA